MFGLYHNLAKKSMLALGLVFFLFPFGAVDAAIPNDPNYQKQQVMWDQIGAPLAWDFVTGSRRVVIATIDTGADIWHDDLQANIWVNPYEIPDNNYDDDNDGYIDDVHGWNFIEGNNDVRTSVLDNSGDPEAVNHGTVVASLVGAVGDNDKNVTGLNWKVSVMPIRAVDSHGSGSYSKVAEAVAYAVNHGADIISLSIVGDLYDGGLREVLYQAYKKGVVIVAAAGNDQRNDRGGNLTKVPNYPVCFDLNDLENWIIGVSSVDNQDRLSNFADFGQCVDIVAPGQNIYTLQRYAPMYGYDEEFGGPWRGTSFATPLVAAAAGLLKAEHPDWTAKQIITTLLVNADNIDNKNPLFKNELGFGRLNIGRAASISATDKFPVEHSSWLKYYFLDNTIYTIEDGVKYFFADTSEAKIIAVGSSRSFDGKRDEVFALIKRGKHYFVQFFTDSGRKWQEKALPLSDYSSSNLPLKISVVTGADSRKIKIDFSQKILKKVKKGKKIVTQTTTKNTVKIYDWLQP